MTDDEVVKQTLEDFQRIYFLIPRDQPWVYEIVDTTDDEMFLTIGIYATLEAAIHVVESSFDPENGPIAGDCPSDYREDSVAIEIRKRTIGEANAGNPKVWSREWVRNWDTKDGAWEEVE